MTTSNIVMSGKTLSRRTFVELVVCVWKYVCMKVHLHTNITVRDVILCSYIYECKHYLCYERDIKIWDVCMYVCMHVCMANPPWVTLHSSCEKFPRIHLTPFHPPYLGSGGTVRSLDTAFVCMYVCMYVCMFICMYVSKWMYVFAWENGILN